MIHHEQLPTAGFGEDPFPIGRAVEVTGGLYRGDRGIVAHCATSRLAHGIAGNQVGHPALPREDARIEVATRQNRCHITACTMRRSYGLNELL